VILTGIQMGGGLYETRVIVPLWSASPPESVWRWQELRVANPLYTPDSGGRFWIYATPTLALVAIALLIVGWKTTGTRRNWLLAATISMVVMIAATFVFFVPTLFTLFGPHSRELDPEKLQTLTRLWVTLNWVRGAVCLFAWLAALKALQGKFWSAAPERSDNPALGQMQSGRSIG